MWLPAAVIVPSIVLVLVPSVARLRVDGRGPVVLAQGAEIDGPNATWLRASSDHFVAVGDTSDDSLFEALTELEVFRAAVSGLSSVLPTPRFPEATPLLVLFETDGDFTPFKPRDSDGRRRDRVAGYHMSDLTGSYMATTVEGPQVGARLHVVLHEYAHDIFHATFGTRLPPWLDEGMAELCGSVGNTTGGQVTGRFLGRPIDAHVRALRAARGPAVAEMFETDGFALEAMDPADASLFYAKSWALVHYLLLGRDDRRAGDVPAFLAAIEQGQPADEAFEAAFRTDASTIDTTIARYVQRMAFPAVRVEEPTTTLRVMSVGPMLESDVERLRGLLLLKLPDMSAAEQALTRAFSLDPSSIAIRTTLARLRLLQHRPQEALDLLTSGAGDLSASIAALDTRGRAEQRMGRFEAAVETFAAAATIDSTDEGRMAAWYGLTLAATAAGRDEDAATAMAQLQAIRPAARWSHARARDLWAAGLDALALADAELVVASPAATPDDRSRAAFVGALAARRLDKPDVARGLLARVAATAGTTWTRRLRGYLEGTVSDSNLLADADGRGQETEAHAYIGLSASLDGRLDEARVHLRWVRDRGWPARAEYDMACVALARIESPGE